MAEEGVLVRPNDGLSPRTRRLILGLDSIELIFAIEAAFNVTITDAEASRLRTLGNIHRLLIAKLSSSDTTIWFQQPSSGVTWVSIKITKSAV
jgi:hypothetical protein